MILAATVDHLWGSEIQPELRPCSSHINRGEAQEQAEYNSRRGRGHETVDEEIFADALRRPEIEAMRAWAKNFHRRSHEAKKMRP